MYLNATLFLAQRFWVFHPALALFFYLVAVAVCVGILMAVANARGLRPRPDHPGPLGLHPR